MATFNQFLRRCRFFLLLTLTILLVNAYVVNAQDNTNSTNSNTSKTNVNSNQNSNANANGNANANQDGNATGNVNANSNQRAEQRKDDLAKSGSFFFLVTVLFAILLGPFIYAITRAILFSKATFSSPLGMPEGSLRAMLAFMLVAFLGFYVYASILSVSDDFKPPDFLVGVVATVIGFYFGSRTSEERGAGTARTTGSVLGNVTDKTGTPAGGGASVELSQSDGKKLTQKADDKGKYKFDNVPQGDYEIHASLAGNASDPVKVKVTAGAALTVDLKLK